MLRNYELQSSCTPTRSEKTHAASFLGQRRATGNGSLSIAILSALRKSLSDQKYNRCAARLIRKKLLATVNPASERATHCCFLASKVLTLLSKTSLQISQIPVFLKIFSPASVTNWRSVRLHATQRSSSCASSTPNARLCTIKSEVSNLPSMMNVSVFAMAEMTQRTEKSHHGQTACCYLNLLHVDNVPRSQSH